MDYNPFSTIALTAWSISEHCCQHTITCLLKCGEDIVTGSKEGLLLVWDRKEKRLRPKVALFNAGCGEILALVACDSKYFASSSISGRLAMWTTEHMFCIKHYTFPSGFSQMKMSPSDSILKNVLFCSGRQAEIVLLDVNKFSIICKLTAEDSWASGWTHSFFVFTRAADREINIIGLGNGGVVRLWSIQNEVPQSDVLECESKKTVYTDATSICSCPGINRIICITSAHMFAIIDGFDFSELARITCLESDTLVDCKFYGNERIISLRSDHLITVYSIKVTSLSSPENKRADLNVLNQISINSERLGFAPALECTSHMIIVGSRYDNLQVLTVTDNLIEEEISCDKWIDTVRDSFKTVTEVSCCICLHCNSTVAVGYCNGNIELMGFSRFLKLMMGVEATEEKTVSLLGHTGRVCSMIHPHSHLKRYDRAYMLSSATDFKICLWDVDHPHCPLHCFTALTNTVHRMFTPPDGHYFFNIVCCETTNGSLSLIYLGDKRQVALLRPDGAEMGQLQRLYWRTKENLLIAQCSDAHVYVWQLETGKLERISRGLDADDIVKACSHCHFTDVASLVLPNPGKILFNASSVNIGMGTVHLVMIEVSRLISSSPLDDISELLLKALHVLPPALVLSSSTHPRRDVSRRYVTSSFYLPDSYQSKTRIIQTIHLASEWALNNAIGNEFTLTNNGEYLCSKILILLWLDRSSVLSEASEHLLKCAATDQMDLSNLSAAVETLTKSFSANDLKDVVIRYESPYIISNNPSTLSFQIFALARVVSLLICGLQMPEPLLKNSALAIMKILNEAKPGTRLFEKLSLHCVVLYLLQIGYPFLYMHIELEAVLIRIVVILVSAANNLRYQQYFSELLTSARSTFYAIGLFDPIVFVHVMNRLVIRAQSSMSNPLTVIFHKARSEIIECLKLLYDKANLKALTVELVQLCLLCGEQGQNSDEELLSKLCRQQNVCLVKQVHRILIGSDQGYMTLFDSIPETTYQHWRLFTKRVDAVSLTPDGKLMAGYCQNEGKLVVWQVPSTSTSIFANASSPKELKTFPVSPEMLAKKLFWITNRMLVLISENGEEMKFTV